MRRAGARPLALLLALVLGGCSFAARTHLGDATLSWHQFGVSHFMANVGHHVVIAIH